MKRFLYIWLPQPALDLLHRARDPRLDAPFAVTVDQRDAHRVQLCNAPAAQAGVRPGQSLADARAVCPELLSETREPDREASLLRCLRRWADWLSPRIAVDAPAGLWLDMSGAAHLFGGEDAMLEEVQARLAELSVTARLALAPTPAAAKAWAKFVRGSERILSPDTLSPSISALPVEALESDASESLHRAGLKTVAQLYPISTVDLTRRFGLDLTVRLNRVLGRQPEPLDLHGLSKPFAARMTLPEPVSQLDAVLGLVGRLLAGLGARLERHGFGARGFRVSLSCPDGDVHRREVGFARPTREVAAVLRQLERPLSDVALPFGADMIRLEALDVQPLHARQGSLEQDAACEDAVERLVTVLGNRLGFDRIRRPAPCQSHRPEYECATRPVVEDAPEAPWPARRPHRPLRMFAGERVRVIAHGQPPAAFEWRGQRYDREAFAGPERVAPEWWADTPGILSDYYAVDTQQGPRLWMHQRPMKKEDGWSVTGVFS